MRRLARACLVSALLAGGCVGPLSFSEAPVSGAQDHPALCRSELGQDAAPPGQARAVLMLEEKMQERSIPGLQAAVVRDGRVLSLLSCGRASLESDAPVVRTTRFQIASATKSFTGVAVMQLVEDGRLKLDAPLADYLDDLPEAWRAITVRQAMMHLSGLPDMVDPQSGDLIDPAGESASFARVRAAPVRAAPGQNYSYNQTNYLLIGRIISKLSGQPFTEMMRKRQFDVVGMPLAVFADAYDLVPGRASSYQMQKRVDGRLVPSSQPQPLYVSYPLGLRAAASLTTTAEEIARWILALERGDLLSPAGRAAMWTTGTMPDGKPTVWAVGWPARPRASHPAVAGIGGGMAAFFVYPEDDAGVVILTNLQGAQPQEFIEEIAGLYGFGPGDGPQAR